MSVVVTQRIEWDMGHRLGNGYASKCRHAHGHRYIAELSFIAPTLNKFGMVMDFDDIKRLVKGWIDNHIDHAFLVYDQDTQLLDFLRAENNRHFVVNFNTTVENIVNWLGSKIQSVIESDEAVKVRGVQLVRVRVYETPNGWAEWNPDSRKLKS